MRKGQVSVFIILAIILIFIFSYSLHVYWNMEAKMPADQEMVYQFVQSCLKGVSEDALLVMGKEGRLEHVNMYDPLRLEYYYQGTSNVPAVADVELELSKYVDEHLEVCVKNFEDFPVLNFSFVGVPDADVKLNKKDVVVKMDYRLEFGKLGVSFDLDEFYSAIPIPIMEYLSTASHMVDYYDRNGAIDASYELPPGVYAEFHKHDTTLVVNLKDQTNLLMGSPYEFSFALQ